MVVENTTYVKESLDKKREERSKDRDLMMAMQESMNSERQERAKDRELMFAMLGELKAQREIATSSSSASSSSQRRLERDSEHDGKQGNEKKWHIVPNVKTQIERAKN